jgi:hypothetical protein
MIIAIENKNNDIEQKLQATTTTTTLHPMEHCLENISTEIDCRRRQKPRPKQYSSHQPTIVSHPPNKHIATMQTKKKKYANDAQHTRTTLTDSSTIVSTKAHVASIARAVFVSSRRHTRTAALRGGSSRLT